MIILGIETSCDETAAAVVLDGKKILSSIVSSQIEFHHPYGGVVPELASRKHLESIVPVVYEAIYAAEIDLKKINAIAVTQGPGLIGSLLVGFSFAKSLAFGLNIPYIAVNHLEGHIESVFLSSDPPEFPFVSLLVSGGHTAIYYVTSHLTIEMMGQTRDDAAGEAYDKVAKMIGLGYPGGAAIDKLSQKGDPKKISFPKAFSRESHFDFSFSGIKTSVNRYIQTHFNDYQNEIADIAAGFQEAVVDVLAHKLIQAALEKRCSHLSIVGGVASNNALRLKIGKLAKDHHMNVHFPSKNLCGDNAAMIAAIGYRYLAEGHQSPMDLDVFSKSDHHKNFRNLNIRISD